MKLLLLIALLAAPLAAQVFSPNGAEAVPRVDAVIVARGAKGTPATKDKPAVIEQQAWTGLILHLKPLLRTEAARLAIVIPLPAEATRFEIADRASITEAQAMHTKLLALAREQWETKTDFTLPEWLQWMKRRDPQTNPEPLPDVVAERSVGALNFTPIRGTGDDALTAVRAWLKQRGFPADAEITTWPGETAGYLCVLVEASAQGSIPLRPELPPIAIAFEAVAGFPLMVFPMSEGALDLTVVSDYPVEDKSIHDARVAMSTRILGYVNLVNLYSVHAIPDAVVTAAGKRSAENPPARWFVNRLESVAVKARDGQAVAPVSFKPGNQTDELPGFWYYGDREINLFETFFRKHALLFMIAMGVGGFTLLFVRTRINRKNLEREQKEKAAA